MRIKELEVKINASIEPILKEIKKLEPKVKSQMQRIMISTQKIINQIDMKGFSDKVSKGIQIIKNKMLALKENNKNNNLKININNKDAEKQISQIEKQIESLQEKVRSKQIRLNIIEGKRDEIIYNTKEELTPNRSSNK